MDPKTGEVGTYDPNSIKPVTGLQPPPEKMDPKKSPTFLAREEIAKRREEERKAEIDEHNNHPYDILNDDGSITPGRAIDSAAPVETEEVATETPPEKPAEESTPVEAAKEATPAEEERELIVDGKTIKVPLSKILDAGIRTFQKETAADLRLAAAAELERQARQRFQPQQAEYAPKPQAPQPAEDDGALAHAIQFGTEEQAKEAITKLRGSGKAASPQEVAGFVQHNIMQFVPQVVSFNDANNWVRNEFKEIFADPLLEQQFMLSENARRMNGDARPHRELYKELAETMVSRFKLRDTPKEAPATPEGADSRIVRKANSPRPVQAAGGQKPPAAPQRAPTVTDYVERQRQLRGLAPLPRRNQSI